jgi:NIPSNAP
MPPQNTKEDWMLTMKRQKVAAALVATAVLTAALSLRLVAADPQDNATPAAAKTTNGKDRFFEMRTYYAAPGKLDDLDARFRDHTNKLFQKHGMELVGYWHPVDKKDVLVYILAYPSREAREKAWKEFNADAEWQSAKNKSEENGKLVNKAESVYMTPTDYSPIK